MAVKVDRALRETAKLKAIALLVLVCDIVPTPVEKPKNAKIPLKSGFGRTAESAPCISRILPSIFLRRTILRRCSRSAAGLHGTTDPGQSVDNRGNLKRIYKRGLAPSSSSPGAEMLRRPTARTERT